MVKTFRFRLKNKNIATLKRMAGAVNFCWNYVNETAAQYLDKRYKWLSEYDLHKLTSGCSESLNINSSTINLVCTEYHKSRNQFKKRKLAWRSERRSLGWIPFKTEAISIKGDVIVYRKTKFRFWKSRGITGKIKLGSFTQDAKGNWYLNLCCESEKVNTKKLGREIGIDLGLKTIATLSNGQKLDRENITNRYATKLATAQRARKTKQVSAIFTKIKNCRRDWNHKETTKIINQYDRVVIGDVSPSKLKKTYLAKPVSDAGWADFKSMLAYKAIALGVEYKEVKENFSTVTCSVCFERTGPSGLSAIGVREWTCSCGAIHDRDVNAAKNILRFGHESLKGSQLMTDANAPTQDSNAS